MTKCSRCGDAGLGRERLATPDEVDNGCELGIAYDPCSDCAPEPPQPRPKPEIPGQMSLI